MQQTTVCPGTDVRPVIAPATGMRAVRRVSWRIMVGFSAAVVVRAGAQNISPAPDVASGAAQVAAGSPRATVERFLENAAAGRYSEAARYLDLPDSSVSAGRGPDLARQLHAVLERLLPLSLDQVSGLATGDRSDGFLPNVEHLGAIAGVGGPRPVRLTRVGDDSVAAWRFSRSTVEQIPAWYAALGDRWALDNLPSPLLAQGPLDVFWWQWIALVLLAAVALVVGRILSRLATPFAHRLVAKTPSRWDDAVLARVGGPFAAALSLALFASGLTFLALTIPASESVYRLIRAGYFVLFFWALWRLIDVVRDVVAASYWAHTSGSSRALVPLASRVFKVLVLAIAVVAVLSMLGYPVASLVAGLGLGGLAFALGAQKTLENLFGAFAIGADQPFREGDFVRIDDFSGTVERIGLRSTRIRTLDRTLITVPNGKLADSRVESLSARDRLRLSTTIGLVYETTASQLREVLDGFEGVLRAQPLIWPEGVVVQFRQFAPSSLEIEVMAWFHTSDVEQFRKIRQDVLLQFMDVVEKAGTSFSFPKPSVVVAGPAVTATGPG
jgi:MscS family membrane protein